MALPVEIKNNKVARPSVIQRAHPIRSSVLMQSRGKPASLMMATICKTRQLLWMM